MNPCPPPLSLRQAAEWASARRPGRPVTRSALASWIRGVRVGGRTVRLAAHWLGSCWAVYEADLEAFLRDLTAAALPDAPAPAAPAPRERPLDPKLAERLRARGIL